MVIVVHDNHNILEAYEFKTTSKIAIKNSTLVKGVLEIAKAYPDTLIIWVHHSLKAHLNTVSLREIFHHKCILSTYNVTENYVISNRIGYVEKTPYTHVNASVNFATWLMSGHVGGIWSDTLLKIAQTTPLTNQFDLYLTNLAKHNMPLGLFCYSNPNLLLSNTVQLENKIPSKMLLFKFVKQHYKWLWVYNLFFCFLFFEGKPHFLAFLKSFFYSKLSTSKYLESYRFKSIKTQGNSKATLDVVIPTLGRKAYLLDVLKDLEKQTVLPENVIIIEQNPNSTETELDYLYNRDWPFKIKHQLIKQTGACNARNLALKALESTWCFLADDDIRFEETFLENSILTLKSLGAKALVCSCLNPEQKQHFNHVTQTNIFASGASIIHTKSMQSIKFDKRFEHGFGEDTDFGMQLRNLGVDIIYVPHLRITHLKAPIGGFRATPTMPWENDTILPKPSPTIMLNYQKHFNSIQIKGIKYLLFIKFYKSQKDKNPMRYFKSMRRKWEKSLCWSRKL